MVLENEKIAESKISIELIWNRTELALEFIPLYMMFRCHCKEKQVVIKVLRELREKIAKMSVNDQ